MNEGLIPRRYAKALYKVAVEKDCAKGVYQLMLTLAGSFAAEPAMAEVVNNPFQSVGDKMSILRTAAGIAAADSADKAAALYDDFMALLVKNNRLGLASLTALAYLDIYRKANNIHVVALTTAAPLHADEEARLRQLIERHLGGATMEFSSSVDPALIGGFAVKVDNERLDASISNQLKQLRLNLLSKQSV